MFFVCSFVRLFVFACFALFSFLFRLLAYFCLLIVVASSLVCLFARSFALSPPREDPRRGPIRLGRGQRVPGRLRGRRRGAGARGRAAFFLLFFVLVCLFFVLLLSFLCFDIFNMCLYCFVFLCVFLFFLCFACFVFVVCFVFFVVFVCF